MKKTKVIKKTDVIRALKTEALRRGKWFGSSKKNCTVCAVGAVLRKVSFEKWARKNNINLYILGELAVFSFRPRPTASFPIEHDTNYLAEKNYLAALSYYYESGHSREQCIEFVKKNFPKQFKLSIELS